MEDAGSRHRSSEGVDSGTEADMTEAMVARRYTAEELLNLPDDDQRHELVRGWLVSEPPTNEEHASLVVRLAVLLGTHVRQNRLGRLLAGDPGFVLVRGPDTLRAPDLAFLASERLSGAPQRKFVQGSPDLVVEILSP